MIHVTVLLESSYSEPGIGRWLFIYVCIHIYIYICMYIYI